jgi:kynurenine formamidase
MPGNWARWGAEDEIGAANLIGPAEICAAAQLVRTGRMLRLGLPLGPGTVVPPHRKRVERLMSRDGGDYAAGARRPGGFQFAEEVWSFAAHSGTHIDALCHAWCDDQLYNGFPGSGTRTTTGAKRCGADKLAPLVTRGLLLDVAPGSALPARTPIGVDELTSAAERAGVQPGAGDVVLIRTGWLGAMAGDPAGYCDHEPGIDAEAARWLAEADVVAVGSDNYAVEVQPAADGHVFPVHLLLLRDYGVPLIENLVLDELADAGVGAFCFVAAPLPLVGGTAGPVNPLALW